MQQIEQNLDVFLDKDYGTETFAKWAGNLLVGRTRPARIPQPGF